MSKIILQSALVITLALSACEKKASKNPFEKLAHLSVEQVSIEVKSPPSGLFQDFLTKLNEQRHHPSVNLTHSKIRRPLFVLFSQGVGSDPIDPLKLFLEPGTLTVDDVQLSREETTTRLAEFRKASDLVDQVPLVLILSNPDVPFEQGLELLTAIADAGIPSIVLDRKLIPSPP